MHANQLLMLTTKLPLHASNYIDSFIYMIHQHVRACIQSVHHQHAHMISDGHASISDVPVKVKTRLREVFSQVVDIMNLCFIHALLNNTQNK